MAVPSGPKGTRDFYPEIMSFQEYLFSTWSTTCKRYSFELYDGPMFEHLSVYTQKSGTEIEKQLYTFEDKGNRQMALRPEITPSLARMVAAKGSALKRPIRWYSIARLFRYEKMQKGRLREFHQLNMDILGTAGIAADAELIAAVIDMMRDLGLTEHDVKVRISSRTLLEECFTTLGIQKEQLPPLYALLDRKSKIPSEVYSRELQEIISDANIREQITALFAAESLDALIKLTGPVPASATLQELFLLLHQYGMTSFVCFDIGIVRGLAYYTGIVFEVFTIDKGMRAIAGGGRYDKLVELYGGPPTPAVGFAAGDVVLGDLLREKGLLPEQSRRCSVFIVALDSSGRDSFIPLAQKLRQNGISCEFPLKPGNIGKQLKQADAARALCTLFTGGREADDGCYRIKHMKSGEESTVHQDTLITTLTKLIGPGENNRRN